MSMCVARSFLIEYFQVLGLFVLVNGEVEIRLGLNLLIDIASNVIKFFLSKLLLELKVI
jgi:uncharacterized membrane protein